MCRIDVYATNEVSGKKIKNKYYKLENLKENEYKERFNAVSFRDFSYNLPPFFEMLIFFFQLKCKPFSFLLDSYANKKLQDKCFAPSREFAPSTKQDEQEMY